MCDKNDANKVVKAVWNEFSKVLKNGISKDEFNLAKWVSISAEHIWLDLIFYCRKKLQVNLQMTAEQSSDVFLKMLNQPDVSDRSTDIQSIVAQLEQGGYSNEALNQLAKKMFSSKQPTLVSIGNLKTMPYIDDLKA